MKRNQIPKTANEEIWQYVRDLRSSPFYCKVIIKLNEKYGSDFEDEKDKYINRLLDAGCILDDIEQEAREIIIDLYVLKEDHDKTAIKFSYSKNHIYKIARYAIHKALKKNSLY